MKKKLSAHYFPLSGREYPRFSGIKTFFRLPYETNLSNEFDIALWGVPFDGGLTYRPGARFGPQAVREISSLGRSYHWGQDLDVFSSVKTADIGDARIVPLNIERSYSSIQKQAEEILRAQKKLFTVGGDHSITLPLLRAFRKHYGTPLSLIHFDAHLDSYPAAWECEYHHGSFVRHALEEGLIDPLTSVQIGLRGPLASKDDLKFNKKWNLKYFTVEDLRTQKLEKLAKLFSKLSFTSKEHKTYISFDVDVLDPAYAPGTGTPVVGGLTSYEVLQILSKLKISNLVGGDVVEISPPYDSSQITSLLGASILFEMIRFCA